MLLVRDAQRRRQWLRFVSSALRLHDNEYNELLQSSALIASTGIVTRRNAVGCYIKSACIECWNCANFFGVMCLVG